MQRSQDRGQGSREPGGPGAVVRSDRRSSRDCSRALPEAEMSPAFLWLEPGKAREVAALGLPTRARAGSEHLGLPAGAGDVHAGPAAVPQGERGQVEAAVSAGGRRHPPDAGQAAGVSPAPRPWVPPAGACQVSQLGSECSERSGAHSSWRPGAGRPLSSQRQLLALLSSQPVILRPGWGRGVMASVKIDRWRIFLTADT